MPSTQSEFFYSLLRLFNAKKLINKTAAKYKRKKKPFFSETEKRRYHILTETICQNEISTMGNDRETPRHVIYFHGGMYVVEGNTGHKRWMINLFNHANCKVTYVDYPLAPEHIYLESIEMVVKAYQFLISQYPNDDFILMGDSAGGGLALVLAQVLRDQGLENRPQKLVLYSPWVRLDMDNPVMQDLIHNDSILDFELLQKSARVYAGGTDLKDKYLSPYYGSCENLGAMHIFYGGDELLAPDIRLLETKCEAAGAEVHFHCYKGMGHDFQLFTFLPESQEVLRKTMDIFT
jgi:acetyl esterase/lipase